MDHAVEELCLDALFLADRAHASKRQATAAAFSFSLAVNKGQEAAPIVADNTMYIVTAYPNYRLCARSDQTGRAAQMEVRAEAAPASQGVACCDVVNRGGSVDNGKYIFNTLDGQTIALDVKTGKPVWRTQLGNINIGETMTMAPVVAEGRVYVGNSGGELGVRGWVAALDEDTGKLTGTPTTPDPTRRC